MTFINDFSVLQDKLTHICPARSILCVIHDSMRLASPVEALLDKSLTIVVICRETPLIYKCILFIDI